MSAESQSPNRLHFAAWRWHFCPGLYAVPFVIIRVVTGIHLHWPRGSTGWGKALSVQTAAMGRSFWKPPRGAMGLWVGVLLVVVLISGLFWAGLWTIVHDSVSNDGSKPAADRTIHIDQFTGNVLADVHYADYSVYAKMMAWGIAFHEGDLGAWNLALNTVFCLAVILMSVSGVVMWVKRRPAGARLGAPPRPADIPYAKGALLITLGLSLAFPMLGLVLLAVIVLDLVILSAVPPLKRLVS